MPVLPIIDLLILVGWTSLGIGAVLKAVAIATVYRPNIFSLTAMDFVVVAAICFMFALTLAARTWVKLNEPRLMAMDARDVEARIRRHSMEHELDQAGAGAEIAPFRQEEATAGHR